MNDSQEQPSWPQREAGEQESLHLTISDMAYRGEGLGRHNGQVVFVPRVIPGEEVLVSIVHQKKGYAMARPLQILKPSPHRVTPLCEHFGPCSGCNWQHIAYEEQLKIKEHIVREQLRRIGKFPEAPVRPTIPAEDPWHYRNHARFTVDALGRLGYVQKGTHRFVPINACPIMAEGINTVLKTLKEKCLRTTQVNVRWGINTGEYMIQPQLNDEAIPYPSGQPYYHEKLMEKEFRVSAASFFQVNTVGAAKLVQTVRERLEPTGQEFLLDAYAGVGTFGILLAPLVRRVLCIEESGPALEDARRNAQGLGNVEFIQGKAEQVFGQLREPPEAVILDPPRIGCHPKTLQALVRLAPAKVIYISCDPATLARDLRSLCAASYHLAEVQPIDLFPQTYHIESVATLVAEATLVQTP